MAAEKKPLWDPFKWKLADKYRLKAETMVHADLTGTLAWLLFALGVTFFAAIAIALPFSIWPGFALVGLCTLIGLAAMAAGALLGFLFGIPRTLSADDGSAQRQTGSSATRFLSSNTNLEQVSDWLTKIVIGATLVEFKAISAGLWDLGRLFEARVVTMIGMEGLKGIGGLVPPLVIIGFTLGFLALYLQTRTFLAIMITRSEQVMSDPKLAAEEVDELREAAHRISLAGATVEVTPAVRALAEKAVVGEAAPVEDPAMLRQRGFAHVVLGQVAEGATLLKRAIEKQPDQELARMVSRLLARSDRPGEARDVLKTLPSATKSPEAGPMTAKEADAALTAIFVSLYEDPPAGFTAVLDRAPTLLQEPEVQTSSARKGRLYLYIAAAEGQRYKHLEPLGDQGVLVEVRAAALVAARDAIAADPAVRSILRNMLEGRGQDDDLTGFKDDPEFRSLILGS